MIGALLLAAAPLVVPIPGRVLHVAPEAAGLLVLAAEEPGDDPVRLLRIRADGSAPETLAEGLPPRTTWAGTVDGQVFVAGAGLIQRITPEGAVPWARDPDLDEVTLLAAFGGRLWTALPQALVSYGPERREEAPLPARAERKGRSLVVHGPALHTSTDALAAGPVETDRRRLRTIVVRPPEPAYEAWARLPGPEQVIEDYVLSLDGQPLLVVTTMKAGKLELFGEKLLRVYPLKPDRTRQGVPPLFATTSRMNLWQQATVHAVDVDGDGKQDLVVRYVKGMKAAQPTLDAYLRLPSGGFDPRPRSTEIEVKDAEDAVALYGGDVDGDRRADLVLAARGGLLLFPGSGAGKGVVSRTPLEIGPLPAGFTVFGKREVSVGSDGFSSRRRGDEVGTYAPTDLDGDGRAEIVLLGRPEDGDRIAILRLPPAADGP